jgi:hypothetical protein
MVSSKCRFCAEERLHTLLDFGPQPLTNRYLTTAQEPEFLFSFGVAQCSTCGVVQLANVPEPHELRSRFPWITYNEPESHLDDVAGRIVRLPGVGPHATVAGLSYKDDTTLARLERLGLGNAWRVDLAADLGGDEPGAGLETLQRLLTPRVADSLVDRHGRADVVIVRHVLEHAHHPEAFLAAIIRLTHPGGHVVFEVPDCTRSLDRCDYSMPWEEHVAYFTPVTLRQTLARHGFEVVDLLDYPYSHENSLVAICRTGGGSTGPAAAGTKDEIDADLGRAARYASEFPGRRAAYRSRLRGMPGTIALFGAGHLTAAFVNILELTCLFDCVIDDNPRKQGLFMPGSRLPIVSSAALAERPIKTCLLGVRPEIETIVREKHRDFMRRGGGMFSIFPGNPHPIPLDTAP